MEVKVFTKGKTNNYDARGIYDGKGITVLKGSKISDKAVEKLNPVVLKKRNDSSIVSSDWRLLEDVWFRSPSTAATFVSGNISNGLRVWKVDKGVDLGNYKEAQNGRY